MGNTYFDIIVKTIYALCFMLCACTLFNIALCLNNLYSYREKVKRYDELSAQYDTTSTYNRLVIYPRIKALGDSLK